MLRTNNAYSPILEAESSTQPASKSSTKGYRDNSKPCVRRDHNHTNPEYVWGDEGPVNERRETSYKSCSLCVRLVAYQCF
jgi:hypothetical protein